MDYSIIFRGHLAPDKSIEGLPEYVDNAVTYRTMPQEEHPEGLCEHAQIESFLDSKAGVMARTAGMYVEFDSPADMKSDKAWGRGKFVPWHMIEYVSYSVRKVVGKTPDMDDEDVVVN